MTVTEQGQVTHFASGRGSSLCGIQRDVSTTGAASQTTCIGCLRILVTNGKDAEGVLQKMELKK